MLPQSLLLCRRTMISAMRYNNRWWFVATSPSVRFNSSNSTSGPRDPFSTEWIPPQRSPLLKQSSTEPNVIIEAQKVHEESSTVGETGVEENTTTLVENEEQIDWLATRRRKLSGTAMATPGDSALQRQQQQNELIPVKIHTLLSKTEIVSCLESLGGQDIVVRDGTAPISSDIVVGTFMGVSTSSWNGSILATGMNNNHLRLMADTLVRHMRARRLQEVGVTGAELGFEGQTENNSETWFVVDCENYVVHLQDEKTRQFICLERIWSGQDGISRIDCSNESQVNQYVAQNPVPDGYGDPQSDWMQTYKQLEKNRWVAPHKRVVPNKKRAKKKRSGNR